MSETPAGFIGSLTGFYNQATEAVLEGVSGAQIHMLKYIPQRPKNEARRTTKGRIVRPRSKHGEAHYLVHHRAKISYSLALDMHKLWKNYLTKALELDPNAYSSIDLHGARVRVLRSKISSCVGVEGIVVRDTLSVLEVVRPDKPTTIIPKAAVDIGVITDDKMIYLIGKLLCRRAQNPAKRFDMRLTGLCN
ncbi:putative Ribonuclease P protein subunit [Giardia muris]|uniref:Putative Ribonuclease P protein subunit n=1 Tax=Giardia muris TaxID=5742 RepID=A0A4Z1SQK0_GIAMU|nr:putative Ribonuclease P protein subunit [Giardia muris]|eukprot:TNJ28132.1 putative Ribonuclease P protein subunit [Giardia muris]